MKLYIKAIEEQQYEYCGSVKDQFGNICIREACFQTRAKSLEEAKSNILYQAKRRLGLKPSAKLLLCKPDGVYEIFGEEVETIPNRPRCPECHSELTDGGYCPICYMEGNELEM